jgi:hypothetical protein
LKVRVECGDDAAGRKESISVLLAVEKKSMCSP